MSSTIYSFLKSNLNQALASGSANLYLAFGKCLGMLAMLMLVLCASSAWAQEPTGTINGTVLDQQGLPVEGAAVTLTNQGTNYKYTSVTGSSGGYLFPNIDHGLYSVSVTKEGFRQGVVENIKLDAATTYSVPPIKLEVGARTESVVVEGGAELVNTTSSEVTGTVEKKQIDDLPILDRNVLGLIGLAAGVNQNGATDTVINGERTTLSNMTLDGINIQDNFIRENALDFSPNYPFSSQAQEFTIINQNADVDKGGGASQVSIVTPKGGNRFHGEGFWYYRTNAWAANDWFNDASGVPIANLLQNQGGGNIGGPIKKDKLFFYSWYELVRRKQQSPSNTTVLSPAIISALTGPNPTLPFTYQPVDPTTGMPSGPVEQNVNLLTALNTARGNPSISSKGAQLGAPIFTIDPTMLALIKRMPTTFNNTRLGDGTNLLGYQFNARNNDTKDNVGGRLDYNINSKNTVSGTFAWNREILDRPDQDTSFDLVPLVQNNDKVKFLSSAWHWNPSSSFTNEVRFGFDLAPAFFSTSQNFSSGYLVDSGTLPFTNPNSNFLPQGRNTRTWMWLDNASWVKGNHVIKFGTQIQRVTIFVQDEFGVYPDYQLGFSSVNPFTPQPTDFPVGATGATIAQSDLADASSILASVAGVLSAVSQTLNATSHTSGYVVGAPQNRNYNQNSWSFYGGDNWRLTPKLTVTYGLRWDYYSPVNERNGLGLLPVVPSGSNIDETLLGNATLDFAGGSGRGFYNKIYSQFGPNIGIAWDPFGNGKTAVRAGYSINYANDEFFTAVSDAVSVNTGLSVSQTNGNLAPPATTTNAYLGPTVATPNGAQNIAVPTFGIPTTLYTNAFNASNTVGNIGSLAGYGIDPNMKAPYVQQWNLSIQRDIGWNTSLTVSYVGNHAVGLLRAVDLNQLNLNALDNNGNSFFTDFQNARAAGFASLAATGTFNPLYGCPGQVTSTTCLPVFNNLYGGLLGYPFVNTWIEQGQIGALIAELHAFEYDTGPGAYPGQANLINWFPNPYIMGADLLENASSSGYNAGIIEVRRRFNKGLYFQANYTYSKVMTDYAGSQQQLQPYQDNARPRLEWQRAAFDLTHAFKANFTYEVPIGKGHKMLSSNSKVFGLLVDGWQTGSVFTWQSGPPFSILSQYATFNRTGSRSVNNTAVATLTHAQIANDLGVFVQGNGVVYGINPKLINPDGTAAPPTPQLSCAPSVAGGFCNPQPGEVGNLQLDAFSGPAYFDWDLAAAKDFNLTEKLKLTFRTEAFNVLNHPVFFMGNQLINSTTFGQSTSTTSAPRILQMSLRLKF